jgi:hypothetical protein
MHRCRTFLTCAGTGCEAAGTSDADEIDQLLALVRKRHSHDLVAGVGFSACEVSATCMRHLPTVVPYRYTYLCPSAIHTLPYNLVALSPSTRQELWTSSSQFLQTRRCDAQVESSSSFLFYWLGNSLRSVHTPPDDPSERVNSQVSLYTDRHTDASASF